MHRWSLRFLGSLIVIAAAGSFAPNAVASALGVRPIVIESVAAFLFLILVIAMTFAGRCYRSSKIFFSAR